MVENIFEYAVENKLRFPFRGSISVEDLFDLSLENLDSIYKTLARERVKANEDSLLKRKSIEDTVLSVKIEIIKCIVSKKMTQIEANKVAIQKKEKKDKILKVLAQKQDESLQNMSIKDLQKMLDEID